jgi:hypothetical protein
LVGRAGQDFALLAVAAKVEAALRAGLDVKEHDHA